jgi:hypothetical protein
MSRQSVHRSHLVRKHAYTAFDAGTLVTCLVTAVPKPQLQANQPLGSHHQPKVIMHYQPPMESTTVSTGPIPLPAPSDPTAQISMDAAFAGNLGMELVAASNEPDPRIIITPLIASHVEELLHKYNLLDDWMHILVGIRNGFDVGVRNPPLSTCLFRKSCLVALKSFLH